MYQQVINFWFDEIEPKQWWKKDDDFDQLILDRFSSLHSQAIQGELYQWRETALGRLAEIIVLDQFSRNMFRGKFESFAYDSLALILSQEAIKVQSDLELKSVQCSFLYMPFMHSESLLIHEVAVELFQKNGEESNVNFEMKHKKIIEKFGRYPHRNEILGRQSTPQEIEFLQQPGSSF
jgi:uncharacterized protein (DUF924 family)